MVIVNVLATNEQFLQINHRKSIYKTIFLMVQTKPQYVHRRLHLHTRVENK